MCITQVIHLYNSPTVLYFFLSFSTSANRKNELSFGDTSQSTCIFFHDKSSEVSTFFYLLGGGAKDVYDVPYPARRILILVRFVNSILKRASFV